jgi:hypothetical protein
MKPVIQQCIVKCFLMIWCIAILSVTNVPAQTCPQPVTTTITSFPNTYYPGQSATLIAGSTSVEISAAIYGTSPISAGDVLLIIQMQGAQINATNDATYGDGANGSGYLNNALLYAGNMEYIIATNAVPLTGGTLTLQSGTVNNYKRSAFGTDGQYTYQVIRVPVYYNLILNADITPPSWDGATGGVIVMAVINNLTMNGHTINVTGAGFRGGGGVRVAVGAGTTREFITVSPTNANISARVGFHASKGEGIAGSPRLINNNHYGSLLLNTAEGYPGGSFGIGAPGNAGGGGNTVNSGGGGGSNGGAGGNGGNSYGTNRPLGGFPGAPFAQRSPARLVMGGGGGAGDTNDGTGNPGSALASSGAAGGGIVIISAGAIFNPGVVRANGRNANTTVVNDAAGGGGAGGSVLINARSGHANLTVSANGGHGGTNFWINSAPQHGPGGGGGGGVIYTDGTLHAAAEVLGGTPGTTNSASGIITYGAQAGAAGDLVTGPVMTFPPGCVVLPMQFLSVNGKRNGAQVLINWEVTNEKNVTNYIIEQSDNGTGFITAGIVSKKPGNGEIGNYTFSPVSAAEKAVVYYRVIAEEATGEKTFSKHITLKPKEANNNLIMFPNPFTDYISLKVYAQQKTLLRITIYDGSGRALKKQQNDLHPGDNHVIVSGLQSLSKGTYILKTEDGKQTIQYKLIK